MFVVVNFDALVQASDFRIEMSCLPLLNAALEHRVRTITYNVKHTFVGVHVV